MVFFPQAKECFSGAFSALRLPGRAWAKPTLLAPARLPYSTKLPSELALQLRCATGGSEKQCAVAGVCSPLLAVLLGFVDSLGIGEEDREELLAVCRQELRQLSEVLVPKAALETHNALLTDPFEPLDVLIAWCSTPAHPTYELGKSLAQGSQSASMRKMGMDLAWIFRFLCERARFNNEGFETAPVLFAVCDTLCHKGDEQDRLFAAVELSRQNNCPNGPISLVEENVKKTRFHSYP